MLMELATTREHRPAPLQPMAQLRIRVLGPLRIRHGDAEQNTGPRQQTYLLEVLLAREGRPTAVEEMIELIWGAEAPSSALNIVHKYIGAIRRLLEPSLPPRAPGSYLHKRAGGYVCAMPSSILDLGEFRDLAARARSELAAGSHRAAFESLVEGLALWSGPVGDGWMHGPDAAPIFAALNDEFFRACIEAAHVADSAGDASRALPALHMAAAMAPLHEPIQECLITLLGRTGQQAEALAVFEAVRHRLAEELGIDPGAALQAARQRVLAQSLDPHRSPRPTPAVQEFGRRLEASPTDPGGAMRRVAVVCRHCGDRQDEDVTERPRTLTRREQYAAQTRRDVVATARRIFAVHGYAHTTVETIAREARVSPATIYAQCGGKEGLLESLIDLWSTGETVERIIADCAASTGPSDKLDRLARGYVDIYDDSGDIIHIVSAAAGTAPIAQEFLETVNVRQRDALELILQPLHDAGELREGLSVPDAARIVFFHFHHPQFVLATETFGWGTDRAVAWLTGRVGAAILRP